MPAKGRLNTWTPLEQPWDTPLSAQDEEQVATSAVLSGATPTDAEVVALLADNPALFVNAQKLARA